MSTPCTGLAGWKSLNQTLNYDTWSKSRRISEALGNLAGRVALHQLQHGRRFIKENPRNSDLYKLPVWERVRRHPQVKQVYVDMCAVNLRDPETKLLIKKPSEIWTSSNHFVKSLSNLRCNGRHKHAQLCGTYKGVNKTHLARTWTWDFASRIAAGVAAVVREYYSVKSVEHSRTYATSEVPPPDKRNRSQSHERAGHHPRDPRRPASQDPTQQ